MKEVMNITEITDLTTGETTRITKQYPYNQAKRPIVPSIVLSERYGVPITYPPVIGRIVIKNENGVDINGW